MYDLKDFLIQYNKSRVDKDNGSIKGEVCFVTDRINRQGG